MSINHFSVLVHGYSKPGAVAGRNLGTNTYRGLFVTNGYLNRTLCEIEEYSRGFILMGNSMRL